MPTKCQFCGEQSVVEEDMGDGREQLVCVECGAVAASLGRQLPETQAPAVSVSCSVGELKQENSTDVCQSCGENLQHGESSLCSECRDLEGETEEPSSSFEDSNITVDNHTSQAHVRLNSSTLGNGFSGSRACPSCGSSDLVSDHIGVEEQFVCKSCGQVVGGQILTNDEPEESSTRTFGNRFQTLPKFSRPQADCMGYRQGMSKISMLHQRLALDNHIKEEAEGLFKQVFYLPQVFNKTIQNKEHIAAACVYIASRQHNLPISLVHFQEHVDSQKRFLKSRKLLVQLLNIKLPLPTLGAQLGQVFYTLGLREHGVDTSKLLPRVREIIFLCRRAWLTSGRQYQKVILIAFYYAYLASNGYMSYNKFCNKFDIPKNTSQRILSEVTSLLRSLAARLPWVSPKYLKPTGMHLYIDDILQYKNSLLHLAFETPEPGMECSFWERKRSALADDNILSEATQPQLPSTAAKGVLLPPSFKKARTQAPAVSVSEPPIPSHIDLDCPDIKPTDFSEQEISSYILNHENHNSLKKAKEILYEKFK